MSNRQTIKQTCLVCEQDTFETVYTGKIRQGVYGSETEKEHQVIRCTHCGLTKLAENLCQLDYYQSEEYRNEYNDDTSADGYIAVHDSEQSARINKIGLEQFRNKVVLDLGCGGGAFLDAVKGVSQATYGIEPFSGFHPSLKQRGHQIYGSATDAITKMAASVDIIISFGVIEHTENPLDYLQDAFNLLKPGGTLYLETDNLDDILMKLNIVEFEKFFYRTAHYWYFDKQTLEKLTQKAGFATEELSFRHNFDLSNTLLWLRDRKPTGCGKLDVLDNRINSEWMIAMESLGFADLIFMKLTKS